MTNEELKEKIVKIIKQNGVYNGKSMHQDYYVVNGEELADALIAAGIGDVKEEKFEADHYWNMWQGALVELEREERRAEVAQLIAKRACELVFSEEINDEDWVNVTTNILYDYLKDQAEKELAKEETNNDN